MQSIKGHRAERDGEALEASRRRGLSVRLARTWDEVEAAQRLRWRIFAQELGADLDGPSGIDHDRFDDHCDHLIAIDQSQGRIVGTYRILPPQASARLGELYSDGEFDLSALADLRPSMMEVGRSCIDPAWRGGTAMAMLWRGVYRYAVERRVTTIVGCASVSLSDGGQYAANLTRLLLDSMVDSSIRVTPHEPFRFDSLSVVKRVEPPTLIKGYLRAGARVGGLPAWDRRFNCADFLMLLAVEQLSSRFARRFGDPVKRADWALAA
jgi:putative hemolysin